MTQVENAMARMPALAAPEDCAQAPKRSSRFCTERLAAMDAVFEQKVADGVIAGFSYLIAEDGSLVHQAHIGFADIASGRPMASDTIYHCHSLTKPITAVALMILYERGYFQLSDRLSKYLPNLRNLRVLTSPEAELSDTVPPERQVTIEDLLRHTAGFSDGFRAGHIQNEYASRKIFSADTSLAETVDHLSTIPLEVQPGTQFNYGIGYDILARLIEVLSGKEFDCFLSEEIFEPLGMVDTDFWVPPESASRLATSYWRKNKVLQAINSSDDYPARFNWRAFPDFAEPFTKQRRRKSGSYGLVTTLGDYWRFAQMLANGGVLDGRRILGPRTIEFMAINHLTTQEKKTFNQFFGNGRGWGLGMAVIEDPAQVGYVGIKDTFYWVGFAKTLFWIDPVNSIVVVAMAQDLGAEPAADLNGKIRAMVYAAMVD